MATNRLKKSTPGHEAIVRLPNRFSGIGYVLVIQIFKLCVQKQRTVYLKS